MASERTVIGVDIGGTKIAAALLRARLPEPLRVRPSHERRP